VRRTILGIAALALCGAMRLAAQQPPSNPPPAYHARPHVPQQLAPTEPQAGVVDATSLGSPLLLDKGWRVAITANPAAATDFDDSTWAVRGVQVSFAEVPDEDHPAGAPVWDQHSDRPQGHQRPFA
jgi:hypothetical protein